MPAVEGAHPEGERQVEQRFAIARDDPGPCSSVAVLGGLGRSSAAIGA
jgi:hypothetical protein